MDKKTQEVYELVRDVLDTIEEPYSEDITDEVCLAIKNNTRWYIRYLRLTDVLTKDVTHNFIGVYTKQITGRQSGKVAPASEGNLIESYTKLVK